MSDGNPSDTKGKAIAVVDGGDEPGCPVGGGGPASWENLDASSFDSYPWYGGYAYPYPYGGGESSAGGSSAAPASVMEQLNAVNYAYDGYAGYGADGWYGVGGGCSSSGSSYGSTRYGGPGAAVDSHGGGYGVHDYVPESFGGSGSSASPFPSPRVGGRAGAPPHPRPGNYWRTGDHCGGASFPPSLPHIGGGGGIYGWPPQHARTGSSWHAGGVGGVAEHYEFYRGSSGVVNGGGGATFPWPHAGDNGRIHVLHYARSGGGRLRSPLRRSSTEQIDDLVAGSLRNLTIGGGRGRENASSRGGSDRFGADDGRRYEGMRLENVVGRMCGIARQRAGCEFLVQMVAEGGAAAARQVLDEVAGQVARLMVDDVGHRLVEELVKYLTDEQITRVLGILAQTTPDQIVAMGRKQAGSNVLGKLIGRIGGNPVQAELFTSTLARIRDAGVLSLAADMHGSRLIMRCLDAFPADQNLCMDTAAGELRDGLVLAVCQGGAALAEDGSGNYVVQHVIETVPAAHGGLHAVLRGRYVGLSRHKAGSHVVQLCLKRFGPELVRQIVEGELLWCDQALRDLMCDQYANYVLQTALQNTRGQTRVVLVRAIGAWREMLQEDRFAKEVFNEMRRFRG